MDTDKIIAIVKEWLEECASSLSYHLGHCDDLTWYYDILREKLNQHSD